MRRSTHGLIAVLGVVAIAVTTSNMHAHGPAPAPLSVLATDDGRPTLVGLSIGMARETSDGFEYVCPSRWRDGAEAFDRPIPLATTANGVVYVQGTTNLMRSVDNACSFSPVGGAVAGRSASLLDLATLVSPGGNDVVYAAFDEGAAGTSLWRSDGTGPFVERVAASVPLQSLVTGSARLVAAGVDRRAAERQLVLVVSDDEAQELQPQVVPVSALPEGGDSLSSVRVRLVDATSVWLVVGTSEGFHLWRADLATGDSVEEIAVTSGAIHGPIQLCGAPAYVVDGQLQFVDVEPACDLGNTEDLLVRCLGTRGDVDFACADFDLLTLSTSPGGVQAETAFSMSTLRGPDLSCDTGDAEADCQNVWVHFGAEAGLVSPEVEPEEIAPEAAPGGVVRPRYCACAATSTSSLPGLWTCLLGGGLLFVHRRRAIAGRV